MADPLTRRERAAIDAYAGPVTVCPAGAFWGDTPLPLYAQIRAQFRAHHVRRRHMAAIREAERECDSTDTLPEDEARRIVEGAQ